MSAIGGYFELEFTHQQEYHHSAFRLNSGRNCLKHLLLNHPCTKIYLPVYICDVVIHSLKELNIPYEFYRLSDDFKPILTSGTPAKGEFLLYVNYFGLLRHVVNELNALSIPLIIDNSQAFFDEPIEGVYAFYSPRKFFGVADGGYLYGGRTFSALPADNSSNRYLHLLTRIDEGPEEGYPYYRENESKIDGLPVAQMSKLTQRHLSSIDYKRAKEIRNSNFNLLHKQLGAHNELSMDPGRLNGPLAYPLLVSKKGIREKLLAHRIFIPTYWPGMDTWMGEEYSFERKLVEYLLPLPIDQRYTEEDMTFMVDQIKALL